MSSHARNSRRWWHRFGGLFLLSAVVVSLVLAYAWRYRSFVRSLSAYEIATADGFARQGFPFLTTNQITQLGQAHPEGDRPESSYTRFGGRKAAGTTRIGVFGCSFVKGSESGPGQDFPSRLKRLFHESGHDHVEVLNFGVEAFGLQQSYLMWEFLADEFDLDYTVVNLYEWHRARDNTFVMLNTIYAPVHARYIVDDGTLRLIEVGGDDRREAAAWYFRMVPPWEVLRFDVKTPPFVRALLPSGRQLLTNPFYYRDDEQRELEELYRLILTDMANRTSNFLVFLNDPASIRLIDSSELLTSLSVSGASEKWTWKRAGLFRAPENHLSGLGYRILAEEVFTALTGGGNPAAVEFEFSDERPIPGNHAVGLEPLSSYEEVWLTLNGSPAGVFVRPLPRRRCEPFSFRQQGKKGLLDLVGGSELVFIAFDEQPPSGDLIVRFMHNGSAPEVTIGRVEPLSGGHVGVVRHGLDETGDGQWGLRHVSGGSVISLEVSSTHTIKDIRLESGGKTVLAGAVEVDPTRGWQRIRWVDAGGVLLTTRGHPRQVAEELVSSPTGIVGLAARAVDGTITTVDTRSYFATEVELPEIVAGIRPIEGGSAPVDNQ